ncbi:MAG: LysR family transcriptional regulator [Candidatus Sericytochromatia bacterium]|nr:LysR family transcriptional regulator [Candidatus Sericytochromatia bacterium]
MNPEWLRYFVALVKTRNFAAAAEQLHITPQAMSNAIAGPD